MIDWISQSEAVTVIRERTSLSFHTRRRQEAEHVDLERRLREDQLHASRKHLAARRDLHSRRDVEHVVIGYRRVVEDDSGAGARRTALGARTAAQWIWMEVRHAWRLVWLEASHGVELSALDRRQAVDFAGREFLHVWEDRLLN